MTVAYYLLPVPSLRLLLECVMTLPAGHRYLAHLARQAQARMALGTLEILVLAHVFDAVEELLDRAGQAAPPGDELLVLGAVILLRGAMAVLIHWEIKGHKRDVNEENEALKLLEEQDEVPETDKLNSPEYEQNTAAISENKVVSELESDVYRTNEVREKSK